MAETFLKDIQENNTVSNKISDIEWVEKKITEVYKETNLELKDAE